MENSFSNTHNKTHTFSSQYCRLRIMETVAIPLWILQVSDPVGKVHLAYVKAGFVKHQCGEVR